MSRPRHFFRRELLGDPLHGLAEGRGDGARLHAVAPGERFAVAVPHQKPGWNVEIRQQCERLARQRPRQRVAADDDLIDTSAPNVLEHRLECREIAVNVVQRANSLWTKYSTWPSC